MEPNNGTTLYEKMRNSFYTSKKQEEEIKKKIRITYLWVYFTTIHYVFWCFAFSGGLTVDYFRPIVAIPIIATSITVKLIINWVIYGEI